MKKILLTIFCIITFAMQTYAAAYSPETKLQTIGETLLTKNGITAKIKFEATSKIPDNSTFAQDRTISIAKDELQFAKNDNETAAVIANAVGNIITGNASKDKLISSVVGQNSLNSSNTTAGNLVKSYAQTKADKEADVIAVNLMANAGYNPLAAIVVLTRQTQTAWNAVLGKPANADRAMNIYDYTVYAYPDKAKAGYSCNEYKNFLVYADNITAQRKDNKKLYNKSQKELAKYRKNSVSQISKFKTRGAMSGWDAAYTILNSDKK